MISLCPNRPWDGPGSFSRMYDGDLTTCFEDVILINIPVWILLLLSPLALLLVVRRKRNAVRAGEVRVRRRWWTILYNVFCVCIVGMSALEMARLAKAHLGIGLLPFVPVGAALALALNLVGGTTMETSILLFAFWIMFAVFDAVRLHTLVRIDHEGYKRTDSQYKTYDQITDNVVILCVAAILAVMSLLNPTRVGVKGNVRNGAAGGVPMAGQDVERKRSTDSDAVVEGGSST